MEKKLEQNTVAVINKVTTEVKKVKPKEAAKMCADVTSGCGQKTWKAKWQRVGEAQGAEEIEKQALVIEELKKDVEAAKKAAEAAVVPEKLEDCTIDHLKMIAKNRGITGVSKMNKEVLVDFIKKFDEAGAAALAETGE